MANRIRMLRKEFHMTQLRLSIELEVSQETVSAYENQKHFPSFPQLLKLSNLFNASIDYIMGLSDVRNPVDTFINGNIGKLVSLLPKLNEIQVELVLAYTQGMLAMTDKQVLTPFHGSGKSSNDE